ncbi:sugar transport protein 8-like [Phragmites australis]|uniref:sugar transport protein 8-like n=1 Tax=Phragmites australis TaxID=29695 RepID=UPI002D767130|nr:sugar transport protein 8-like [Phragmites australis]
MAGGFAVSKAGAGHRQFKGKITWYVWICGIIAATSGLMFGYDIGISGGVTAMDDFLVRFFPAVYARKHRAKENNYCKFDDQRLQLFTSSLYLAALAASFVASRVCTRFGRKRTMQAASVFFLIGSGLCAGAVNLVMLIIGRVCLGVGVGFGNQAAPLFLSEIAPAHIRGALNILFQLNVTIGILIASVVNYFASNVHPVGWRYSLGGAAAPAAVLFLGSLVITETPTSLVERGRADAGRATLEKIRGTAEVDDEYEEIRSACEHAAALREEERPYRRLMRPESRPPLVIAIAMQVFQQFTGINAIMFYAPVLFQTMGFESDGSLLSAVVTGGVNVISTIVSIVLVDKVGRRKLLLEACAQMLVAQTAVGGIMLVHVRADNNPSRGWAVSIVVLICVYVSSFAWSWGPLGWLIPSETFPLETRTAGFSFAVSSNMLFTFLIAQAFLSMMCSMRAYIFFFFAVWIVAMGVFVLALLPETKGVSIDEMVDRVWRRHWFWKRCFGDADEAKINNC